MLVDEIRAALVSCTDVKYKQFNDRIVVSGDCPTFGIRIPDMRRIAKAVASGSDFVQFWRDYPWEYFEDIMLRGMVVGYRRGLSFEDMTVYIDQWLGYACSWAHIDCVTSGIKIKAEDRARFWDFACSYLGSDELYKTRFAVVALMNFFIDDEHIDRVLDIYKNIKSNHYYVQMGVAWGISVCFVKFREKTLTVLERGNVEVKIQNLAIRKIIDSFRVTDNDKTIVRTLKR